MQDKVHPKEDTHQRSRVSHISEGAYTAMTKVIGVHQPHSNYMLINFINIPTGCIPPILRMVQVLTQNSPASWVDAIFFGYLYEK